ARVVCPSSAGARHAPPYGFMNRLVYPLTEAQFLEDARARMPGTRIEPHTTGATYRIRAGDVMVDPRGASNLVSVAAPSPPDPRSFRPLEIPPIVDPNFDGRSELDLRSRVDGWVRETLAPALARAASSLSKKRKLRRRSLRYVLEVVFPNTTDAH